MSSSWSLPYPVLGVGLALLALVGAVVPTALYLYVEPRGRRAWARAGDSPSSRRAPGLVRLTGWLTFALAQLALPWLLVPAACAGLLYAQLQLGLGRPVGVGLVLAMGLGAIGEALLAFGLFPLGVRLLSGDARACAAMSRRARWGRTASTVLLAGAVGADWLVGAMPSVVHPILRYAVEWAAIRPVGAFAALALAHSLLLARCARALPPGGPS